MYSEFIRNLPTKPTSSENFLVKGLKVPLCNLENPIAQVIGNYYKERENIVVFTSPNSGKIDAIREITSKFLSKYVILTEKKYLTTILSYISGPVFLTSEFTGYDDFEYLIFYNSEMPRKIENKHISAFYNFESLYKPSLYKDYISNRLKYLPDDFIFTTICKYPRKKKIDFVFGTSEEIKHLTISQNENGLIFYKQPLTPLAEKYFANKNVVSEIPDVITSEKFIFYDLDVIFISNTLDIIDHIVLIYTKADFTILSEIVEILKEKDIEIPEFIFKIINKN